MGDKITIVMFSGGVDSTSMLYKLLKETDDEIIAHHINFINRENRFEPEKAACQELVKWLIENIRTFEYTESTFSFPYKRHIGWDIIHAMYTASLVAKNYMDNNKPIQICIGDTADDFGVYQWKTPIAQAVALLMSLEHPKQSKQNIPIPIQPIAHLSKEDLVKTLPEDLLKLTWTCRRPVVKQENNKFHYIECLNCSTCKSMTKIYSSLEKEKHQRIFTITRN